MTALCCAVVMVIAREEDDEHLWHPASQPASEFDATRTSCSECTHSLTLNHAQHSWFNVATDKSSKVAAAAAAAANEDRR